MTDIPGFRVRTTAKGYDVLELDAWADPARGPEWLAQAERNATSRADFERNVLRNWNITGGSTFFPEFGEVGRSRYEWEPPVLLKGTVIRGWDFGWRAPRCVWLQYSLKSDRVYVLREFCPNGISAHHFRDAASYLSGQLTGPLEPQVAEWIDMWRELPGVPSPPWFPPGTAFVDLSGPEVNAVQSISARDPEQATVRQVFAAGGIEFAIQIGRVRGRAHVLRRLLPVRQDGRPGILISPSCVETLAMLDGGLTFRKGTVANPRPEEPKKDGRFDNIFDALTYALVGMVAPDGVPGVTPGMAPWPTEAEQIGWTL